MEPISVTASLLLQKNLMPPGRFHIKPLYRGGFNKLIDSVRKNCIFITDLKVVEDPTAHGIPAPKQVILMVRGRSKHYSNNWLPQIPKTWRMILPFQLL